jgi:hypothetical protein
MRLGSQSALLVLIVPIILAIGAGASAAPADGRAEEVPTVLCRDAILRETTAGQKRIVLGVVSLPPAYLAQVVRWQDGRWGYWRKAGLVIQAGSPLVRVSVPKAWRDRVAIGWGGVGPLSSLQVEACAPPPAFWYAFSGGFSLSTRSACVPLRIQVAERSTTVRFGIGRRCN